MMLKSLLNYWKQPKKRNWTLAILLVWLILVHLYTVVPVSPETMLCGIVLLEDDRQVLLHAPDGSTYPITPREHSFSTGFFVDADGLIETRWHHPELLLNHLSQDSLHRVLSDGLDSLQSRLAELRLLTDEMEYYKRTHTIYDEGYNQVMSLNDRVAHESDSLTSLATLLEQVLQEESIQLSVSQQLRVYYRPSVSDTLLCLDADEVDEQHCRLRCGRLPNRAFVFNPTSLRWWNGGRWALGYLREPLNPSDSSAFLPSLVRFEDVDASVPLPDALSGAPVVDHHAHLRAVCQPEGWQDAGGFSISPARWWRSVRQGLALLFSARQPEAVELVYEQKSLPGGVQLLSFSDAEVAVSEEQRLSFGRLVYPDSSWYKGFMRDGQRVGQGTYVTPDGVRYVGVWDGDTLPSGERVEKNTRFVGDFDAMLRPSGGGVLSGTSYYEGDWFEGRRHGFGVGLVPGRIVSIGRWRNDQFRGERIVFNADRVYGIDIARYQHEQGKHVFPILWNRLRMVSLGVKVRKTIDGPASFPIHFCFIKATQGTKTVSKYCEDDARRARAIGIKVGQYHFFSPMSGSEQAQWFLRNAHLCKGDLPPVLDVELSQNQIESMGGPDRMIAEMCEWVRVVRQRCHAAPILYLNQSFVDQYMADAPEELQQCPVWIARYSEFRPYVRLAFWQLSDDGTVIGIRGKVDVDIFNGSVEQFEDFVRENGIR